jgi:hypothetical protein
MSIENGDEKTWLRISTINLIFLAEFQLLVSVILLFNSLTRLKRSFSKNPIYVENKTTMSAQIWIMMIHLAI